MQSNVNPSIKINPCVMDEETFNIVLNIDSQYHKLCNSLLVASRKGSFMENLLRFQQCFMV